MNVAPAHNARSHESKQSKSMNTLGHVGNTAPLSIQGRRSPKKRLGVSATIASLTAVPDPVVLALAAEHDRILVSHDFQTMSRHFAEFLQAHGSNPRPDSGPPAAHHWRSDRRSDSDLGCFRGRGMEERNSQASTLTSRSRRLWRPRNKRRYFAQDYLASRRIPQ